MMIALLAEPTIFMVRTGQGKCHREDLRLSNLMHLWAAGSAFRSEHPVVNTYKDDIQKLQIVHQSNTRKEGMAFCDY